MEVARQIMDKDREMLRALADLDRTGFCTLDGETFSFEELRAKHPIKLKKPDQTEAPC